MEFNQNNNDNLQEIIDRNEKVISTEKVNYLYPNRQRMNNQMRWFKASSDRALRSEIAA